MIDDGQIRKPDFVIVGTHYQDGVIVLASDSLSESELRKEVSKEDFMRPWTDGRTAGVRVKYELEVKFKDYRFARGRTYVEAMANLFHQWHPHERDQLSMSNRMPKTQAIEVTAVSTMFDGMVH